MTKRSPFSGRGKIELADCTPGVVSRRDFKSMKNWLCLSELYLMSGRTTLNVNTFSGRKPLFTRCKRQEI